MDPLDLVSSAIQKMTSAYGRKVKKEKTADPIPEEKPFEIKGGTFRAGFAREEIMPDMKLKTTYWIAGHGSGHKMQGILTKVYTHAIWLDCGGDEGIIWLSLDCVGLTNIEVGIIRDKIMASPVIKGCKGINVSVTHSHSGIDTLGYWGKPFASIPADGKNPEYMSMLFTKCLWAAENAYKNAKEGKLYFGSAKITDCLQTGRRIADRHEILYRFRFAPADGGDEIWVINTGAHPNSLGGDNRLLSGEYPYYLRENIKKETGADAFITVGAIGGMDAKHVDDNDKINCIKMQARMFADAAESVDNDRELSPEIRFLRQQFYMPACNNVLMLLAMKGTMSFNAFPCENSDTGVATKTELTYVSIGDAKLLCLPGENFVTTVYGHYNDAETSSNGCGPEINPTPLAEIAGDENLVVFGNTNDMTGYVVPPNDWVLNPGQPYLNGVRDRFDENHYHETNSMGPETQKVIADTFGMMVKNFGE